MEPHNNDTAVIIAAGQTLLVTCHCAGAAQIQLVVTHADWYASLCAGRTNGFSGEHAVEELAHCMCVCSVHVVCVQSWCLVVPIVTQKLTQVAMCAALQGGSAQR